MSNLPKFEVVFPRALDLRPVTPEEEACARTVAEEGVPKSLFDRVYAARRDLMIERLESEATSVVIFGSTGLTGRIGVDVQTGVVVEVIDGRERFVNTSLARFAACIRGAIDRFPYYGADSPDEDVDESAGDVSRALRSIDPQAMDRNQFWSTFVDDVAMGSLTTEEIVS